LQSEMIQRRLKHSPIDGFSRQRSHALVGGSWCPGSVHQLLGACLFAGCREPFVLQVLFGAR
jgi:hypothetical protein